jgi:CheY-like chemotaxis protein
VAALERGPAPGVVLLDAGLDGERSGLDVLGELRGRAELADVPMIVVSDDAGTHSRGLALHGAEILTKPVSTLALQRAIQARLDGAKGSVLVVDDDEHFCRQVAETMAAAPGIEVCTCTSGADALARMRRRMPDLLVLDLAMPDPDGFAVLEALRQDPDAADLPVLVVTGCALTDAQRSQVRRSLGSVLRGGRARLDELAQLVTQLASIARCVRPVPVVAEPPSR